jgi:RHS repeat-associated protein
MEQARHRNQKEFNIYGSLRLGTIHPGRVVGSNNIILLDELTTSSSRRIKNYELSNHLGNILNTVSDQKTAVDGDDPDDLPDSYRPSILSRSDYYPFGLEMPGRTEQFGSLQTRFGFNGKEKDTHLHNSLTHYDYGFRIYNPAIGRFLTVDPLEQKYPSIAPYTYVANNPINLLDPDGRYILPAKMAEQYSKLAGFLQNGIKGLLANENIRSGLKLIGGFSDDQISELSRYGEGIQIQLMQLDNDAKDHPQDLEINGLTDSKSVIKIDETLAIQLQYAASPEEESAALLGIVSTILHETIHAGQMDLGKRMVANSDGLFSRTTTWDGSLGYPRDDYFYNNIKIGNSEESGHAFENAIWNFSGILVDEDGGQLRKQGFKGMQNQYIRYLLNERIGDPSVLLKIE